MLMGRKILKSDALKAVQAKLETKNLKGRNFPKPKALDKPTGFIICRLKNLPRIESLSKIKSLKSLAKQAKFDRLLKVMEEYGIEETRPLISAVSQKRLLEMEQKASRTEFAPLHSLTSYWKLNARKLEESTKSLLKALNSLPEIDTAYAQMAGSDPLVDASNDTYAAQQGYLDAAPDGIDARWAWTQPNGEGAGVGVIDVEQGWFLNHEDYATKSPTLIFGTNRDGFGTYKGNHGTAVLGEMVADDNTLGVVGIAPTVSSVRCSSHFDGVVSGNTADAIIGAVAVMPPGDMMIIEIQTTGTVFGAPVELFDDVFDAIRLASALGICVFEAAGNGNVNLDTVTNTLGNQVLNPGSADFRDSGAIIVGAAESALPHNRASFSSFGPRVNCYGWGENVATCGYGDLDAGSGDDETYTSVFSGTSSATPIVTGAGLIVQGMLEANTGTRLSPQQMRLIMSNPATGTAQGGGVAGNIGVMPDLRAIIEDALDLSPDIYIRDQVSDDGTVPSVGSLSSSPDIIVRPSAVADANVSFGEGSGTENSNVLGSQVEAGQDNFIYARMKNRGTADTVGATARIFWSPASTLVTPDLWTEIGVTSPIDVPQGDTLEVTDALVWDKNDIPGTGHYCFVGLIGHPADPEPTIPPATDWTGFLNFIRNENNAAWRNFNVVDNLPDDPSDPFVAEFLIANAPDRRRQFGLRIEQKLARGVQVILRVPMGIAKPFLSNGNVEFKVDRETKMVDILLPRTPNLVIPELILPAKARMKSAFIIKGLQKNFRPGNMIAISQHFKDMEVGRVSWKFVKKRERKGK